MWYSDLILRHSVIAWMAVNNGLYTLAHGAGLRGISIFSIPIPAGFANGRRQNEGTRLEGHSKVLYKLAFCSFSRIKGLLFGGGYALLAK